MCREPLPAPPLQGLAPLPAGREGPGSPAEEVQTAENAPEPLLDGVDAGRPGHQRLPSRPPAAHRRPGRGRALRPVGTAALGPDRPPGAGGRPGRLRQPDPQRAGRTHPRPHPRPVRQPAGQQRRGPTDHPVPVRGTGAPRGHRAAGHPHRQDHPAGAGHHRRPPLQPVQARARPDRRHHPGRPEPDPVGHPLHQRAPGRLPRGRLGPDHRAHLSPGGAARPGPGQLPGDPDPRVRLDHQQHRAPGRRGPRATRPATPTGSPVWSTSTSRRCGAPRGPRRSR